MIDISRLEKAIPKDGVRTRFAPSPTGYMHVGNLRTALYEYLIAKKNGGKFILRIEDTDQARLVEGSVEVIYKTLKDCGLKHDEGPDIGGPTSPYIQSERKSIYRAYAELLIEKGGAYRCFCDSRRLEEMRAKNPHNPAYDGHCRDLAPAVLDEKNKSGVPYVIRQRIPDGGSTTFKDAVFGEITVENSELDDNILIKSDGLPTYNFANVIDDHLMGITHVVRGSEYLSSTPKYNLLYESFGWEIPVYVHCPPVMKDAHSKLSKRSGDATYEDLIELGYLSEAILNYVALLGWSPGGEVEIFSLDELAAAFTLEGISKSPAIFDIEKLKWFNSEYIKKLDGESFYQLAEKYLKQSVKKESINLRRLAGLIQSRCQLLTDIPEMVDFFDELPEYENGLYVHKKMKTTEELSLTMLKEALEALKTLEAWDEASIYEGLVALVQRLEVKNGQVLWPVRIAVSGKQTTPGGAVEICAILGKDESLARIEDGIGRLTRSLS